jgi:hypothetical protein
MEKTMKKNIICLSCVLAIAGCGLLKKETAEQPAAPKILSADEALETTGTGGKADTAVEPQVKAGAPPQTEAAGSATFTVKADGDAKAGIGISPGSYTVDLKSAGMVTGTENGLKLAFESPNNWMSVFLPSVKKLGIKHVVDDKGSLFELKHAALPFSIGSDDYPSDPKDGRGRSVMIGPVVTNIIKLAGGSTARITHFKTFKITITSLSTDGHALTMSFSFEGESAADPSKPSAVYSISGNVDIRDAGLGLTHKD